MVRAARTLALVALLFLGLAMWVGAKSTPSSKSSPTPKTVQKQQAKETSTRRQSSSTRQKPGTAGKTQTSSRGAPTSTAGSKAPSVRPSGARSDQGTSAALRRRSPMELGDPYEFSLFFRQWWNIAEVSISWDLASAWLQKKQEEGVQKLVSMLGETNENFEKRRTNARRATVALYLIGRLRQQSVAIPPAPLAYHAAALRLSVLNDAAALAHYAELEERLRSSSAMMLDEDFRSTSTLVGRAAANEPFEGVTRSEIEIVGDWNSWLLAAWLPQGLPDILAEFHRLAKMERTRFSLRQLAPPAPDMAPAYWPLVGEDVPLPVEPLPTPRSRMTNEVARAPKHETVTLRVAPGAAIRCVAAGVVRFAGAMRGLERVVIVEHAEQRFSIYGLLGSVEVSDGQAVRAGEVVGRAAEIPGQNEVPVIFEVREANKAVSPRVLLGDRDPYDILVRP